MPATWFNDRDQLLHRQNGTAWQLFKNSEIDLHGEDRDLTVWNLATKGREFSPEAQSFLEISMQVYGLYYTPIISTQEETTFGKR